eukprot:TRINITY_DN20792_c0_g1_i1.p2 TRINITY_DN20792_c0_g1~~TRINITY_DN20792_c0_g1_i1.p2  ORF type:complete len:148 (-),score=21.31 TRINITY_DN20792_c0_g1_i1:166-609(-)
MGGCRSSARSSQERDTSGFEHSGGSRSTKPKQRDRRPSGSSTAPSSSGECDRCDGDHATDRCPIFRRQREDHPDALRRKPMDMGGGGGNFTLRDARVVRQPGDGSCLFHSMAYGLGHRSATGLRREIAEFIAENSGLMIAETPCLPA